MKRSDLIASCNHPTIVRLAEIQGAQAQFHHQLRGQQATFLKVLDWFGQVEEALLRTTERQMQVKQKLQQLFSMMNTMLPPEPPKAKASMSFEQLERVMRVTYESQQQLHAFTKVQSSL